jgi:tRNA 2-thiouridine synthesizing protein A
VQGQTRGFQVNHDKELDARGLACPLPIVKTNKTISQMTSGQVLRVLATDTGSVADMKVYSEQTGHQLLSSTQENGVYVFYLKRS